MHLILSSGTSTNTIRYNANAGSGIKKNPGWQIVNLRLLH